MSAHERPFCAMTVLVKRSYARGIK